MVAVSADDYAWFTEQYADLADARHLTLVRGRTPAELLEQLGAENVVRSVGVRRLASFPVAATALGDWTLLITADAVNGRQLSRGTTLVSHSAETFVWARDGESLLEFDPADASHRTGSDPDGVVELLARLGFETVADSSSDGAWGSPAQQRERSLALAEQLTGAGVTLEALESATFTCGALSSSPQPVVTRPASKAERWDEEYDAPDDDWSDAATDEDGDIDSEEREWPRLIAKVRRAFS